MSPVYEEMREWQRKHGYVDFGGKHVLVCVHRDYFFEFTAPEARFVKIRGCSALKGRWKQFRYIGGESLDIGAMVRMAQTCKGRPYDYFELLDFKLADVLGLRGRVLRWLGNPENGVRVCSTGTAMLTREAGIPYEIDLSAIPPAYWANRPETWELHDYSRHFDNLYEEVA